MNSETAYLIDSDRVFFATQTQRPPHSPHSAITRLIQGIYEAEPAFARKILRNRIFATSRATEMCLGMVRVAAKRMDDEISASEAELKIKSFSISHRLDVSSTFKPVEASSEAPFQVSEHSPEAWMKALLQSVKRPVRSLPLYLENRAIAAVLLSPKGELLSWAHNTQTQNRSLHAELGLIQSFYQRTGKPIPRGATIVSTLKPCKMCAGMIWECSEDVQSIRVYYGEMDNGPHARTTVLNPGSLERKRAGKTPALQDCEIEKKLSLADEASLEISK